MEILIRETPGRTMRYRVENSYGGGCDINDPSFIPKYIRKCLDAFVDEHTVIRSTAIIPLTFEVRIDDLVSSHNHRVKAPLHVGPSNKAFPGFSYVWVSHPNVGAFVPNAAIPVISEPSNLSLWERVYKAIDEGKWPISEESLQRN